MLDTVFGLPVHSLVVHGAVVLLPLAALASALVLGWAAWRGASRRVTWGVVGLDAVALVTAVVAKESGQNLYARIGMPARTQQHTELGDSMPLFAAGLLVAVVVAVAVLERWRDARAVTALATVAVLVMSTATLVWAVRVGHSGTESVWGSVVENTRAPG